MWIDAEIVLTPYIPLILEKGMLFVRRNSDPIEIYELEGKVENDDIYMAKNGCPVEVNLFELFSNTQPYLNQLATHDEIGWVDEGDDSEDMHDITLEDLNTILGNKMRCQVQVHDKPIGESYIPIFDEERVIIRLIEEE